MSVCSEKSEFSEENMSFEEPEKKEPETQKQNSENEGTTSLRKYYAKYVCHCMLIFILVFTILSLVIVLVVTKDKKSNYRVDQHTFTNFECCNIFLRFQMDSLNQIQPE